MPKTQLSQRQRRTSPKRVLGVTVALVVVFLLLASVIGLVEKYIAIRKRVRDLKEEQKLLTEKYVTLQETNRFIETKEGQEYALRSKYNVVKPGEGVIVVTEPSNFLENNGPTTRVGKWWDSLLRGIGIRK